MSLNSYFDAVYCINMDSRPERWQDAQVEANTHGIALERFSACVGTDQRPNGKFIAAGMVGCTLSHRTLYRQIADGQHEHVLILEDDFQVITPEVLRRCGCNGNPAIMKTYNLLASRDVNERFDAMIKRVPLDWDVLYLGGGYDERPIARVDKHVIRCGRMATTSSYGVAKKFAQDVTAMHPDLSVHPAPADSFLAGFSLENKFYVFQPRLMIQRPGKSDITLDHFNDYINSLTDPSHENMV